MIKCPECHGSGQSVASFVRTATGCQQNVPHPCTRCGGIGQVPGEVAAWIETGARMRAQRLAAGRSLRAEAERRGMAASVLSAMEFGRVVPVEEPT
jgi:hypothetical protein